MNEIRIQKIDGVEFVTYKDYLRLKEIAHNELEELKEAAETIKELEEENQKLQEKVTTYSEEYGKLREEKQKLRDRIAELEKCNLNLQEQIDKITKDRDERKRKEECSNVIIERAKERGRENGWTI